MATSIKSMSKCPSINLTPCKSSQVHAYGFDAATNTLAMQFKQGKDRLSAVYHYSITPELFTALNGAESKGKFFGAHIKALDCVKLVPDDDGDKAA